MTSNGAPLGDADTKNSLEKIKKQLASSSGRNLLQGPLLKRSETLRKWNERWVILDPTTGKMEYEVRRNEPMVKGTMVFDANSTITISPMIFLRQVETMQIFEEKTESCLGMDGDLPRTKHVNPSEENVDKACLNVSKALPGPAESEWSDIQTTEPTIADVREVSPDKEGSSLDIPVLTFPVNGHQEHSSSHQP